MPTLALDVWVDLVSPACYLAKRRLEAAIAASGHPAEVTVTYRAFELDPDGPAGSVDTLAAQQGRIQHASEAAAIAAVRALAVDARPDGVFITVDGLPPVRTLDAHRILAGSLAMGGPAQQSAALERLFAGYFTEGKAIDDVAVLLRLAAEAGLDERRVGAVLASDEYLAQVRADEGAAAERGITSVPFVLAGEQVASAGLQSIDGFARLLGLASDRM